MRGNKVELSYGGDHVVFVMPMTTSWSAKKKLEMDGEPHEQKPDVDNLLKGLLDAVFVEDCRVWDIRGTKLGGQEGAIVIKNVK